jgi:hypothetical protein
LPKHDSNQSQHSNNANNDQWAATTIFFFFARVKGQEPIVLIISVVIVKGITIPVGHANLLQT